MGKSVDSNKTSTDKEFYNKIELDKLDATELAMCKSMKTYEDMRELVEESIERYILSTRKISHADFNFYEITSIINAIKFQIATKENINDNDIIKTLLEKPEHTFEITYKDYARILYASTHMDINSTTEPVFQIMKDETLLSFINEAADNYEKDPLADAGKLATQVLIKIIGIRIRRIREKHCYTYKYLSQRTGLSVAYLNKIEHGKLKRYLNSQKMYGFKIILDCSWDYLLGITPFFNVTKNLIDFSNMISPYSNAPIIYYPLVNLFLRVINQKNFNEKEMVDFLAKQLSIIE